MTDKKKPLSIEFAPGCFDSFEGTQEELDAMVNEIKSMFNNMTPEELEARSQPVDLEFLEELDEEEAEMLIRALNSDSDSNPRKLQ